MGVCLIGALDLALIGQYLWVGVLVAFALGFVIFVHELGHFAVARLCGVKCEKFMIGFDIGGYKLSRKWGETEYGIGILPFGGYVKMLGQDDNPANVAEQLRESQAQGDLADAKAIVGPDGKTYYIDRRSYMAKSVPQRMAIISAGVVMNVIFAFVFATIAYKVGVPYNPTFITETAPGSPAWQADIRPGDEIVDIGGVKDPSFAELRSGVVLGDLDKGVSCTIRRGDQQITTTLHPEEGKGLPRIGVAPARSLRLNEEEPVGPESQAAEAKPGFKGGDEITAVDGQPVANYGEFSALLVKNSDKPVTIQIRRGGKAAKNDPDGPVTGGELVDVTVEPRPMVWLGLVMQMGRVVTVQDDSPAAKAGIKPGDFIDRITEAAGNGQTSLVHDPITLPQDLRPLARDGREVKLILRHDAGAAGDQPTRDEPVVALRPDELDEAPLAPDDPVAATSLGVAYRVLNVVASVAPDSPAAKAGLESGDVVTKAVLNYPADSKKKPRTVEFSQKEGDGLPNWPSFMSALQWTPAGTTVALTFRRGDETKEAELDIVPMPGYFQSDRGFQTNAMERIRIAKTWGEAIRRGYAETLNSLGMVYKFLGKLGRQVPVTELGGPLTIVQAAGINAFRGIGSLLVFLTMLSANLAVLNFLPIPVLDGGHMVFLAWEGIRGKPAGEKFALTMQTAGLLFIITLMLFVLSLDVHRLFT